MDISLTRLNLNTEELSELKSQWLDLEQNSNNCSFFVSWCWIGLWLETLSEEVWLLKAQTGNTIVALGLLVPESIGVGPFRKTRLHLNKTGEAALDQIWTEYNDVVFHHNVTDVEQHQIRQYLLEQNEIDVQEVHVDLCVVNNNQPNAQIRSTVLGYLKHLVSDNAPTDLLSDFSKNTRQQIKRSKKLLEEKGLLKLECATEGEHKHEILMEISTRHKAQWRDSEWGSGFDNPHFLRFHQQMINSKDAALLKLWNDDDPIAYGYYFFYKKKVYFYLSAIEKDQDKRIKVGLVFHYLAMQYFQNLGYTCYDFLGGEARYKQSLSDESYTLYSWRIEQSNMFAMLKNTLSRVKTAFDFRRKK